MSVKEIEKTMSWIYEAKAKVHEEIKDLTAEEMVEYFREHTSAFVERTGIQLRKSA